MQILINNKSRLMVLYLFVMYLMFFITEIFPSGLVFKYQGQEKFTLLTNGNISVYAIEQETASDPAVGTLLFEHVNQSTREDALWVDNSSKLSIKGEYVPYSSSFPEVGLTFSTSEDEIRAELSPGPDFFTKGGNDNADLVSSVIYVDNLAVFTQDPNNPDDYNLAYENIISGGIEGKIKKNTQDDVINYYIKDHLGSIRSVIAENTSHNAEVTEDYLYHSFGRISSLSTETIDGVRNAFTGKEFDKDGYLDDGGTQSNILASGIKLNYFGARYYDPEVGVWTSVDPMNEFWNSYSYVGGNPLNLIDPLGLSSDKNGGESDDGLPSLEKQYVEGKRPMNWVDPRIMIQGYYFPYSLKNLQPHQGSGAFVPEVEINQILRQQDYGAIAMDVKLIMVTVDAAWGIITTRKLVFTLGKLGWKVAWNLAKNAKVLLNNKRGCIELGKNVANAAKGLTSSQRSLATNLANQELKGGATQVGRALQKHANRSGSWLEGLSHGGNNLKNTSAGNKLIGEIMQNGQVTTSTHKVFGNVTKVRMPDGRGFWYNSEKFIGFLERYTPR